MSDARRPHALFVLCLMLATPCARAQVIAGGDAFEPDSCPTARSISSGEVLSGFLNPSTDKDYYAITAACGDLLRVDVVPGNQKSCVALSVYGPGSCATSVGGAQGFLGGPFDGSPMTMVRQVTAPGTYVVEIRTGLNVNAIDGAFVGPYTVSVTTTPGPCSAPAEPADTDACATAMVLDDGAVVRRAISPAGDRDFYAIPTSCGDQLFVCVTPTSGTWAARYDRHGIGDSACAFSPTFLGSTLPGATLTFVTPNATGPGDGIFRFRVSSNTAGGTGSYTIAVVRKPLGTCLPDGVDGSDETRVACRALPAMGSAEPHALAPAGDQDWFCAPMLRGQRLTVGAEPSSGTGRRATAGLIAYDQDGAYVDSDRGSGTGPMGRLRFAAPEDGDYAIQVTSPTTTAAPGGYDVVVHGLEDGPTLHAASTQSTSAAGTLVTATPEMDAPDYGTVLGSAPLIDVSATGTSLGLVNERFALLDLPFPFEFYGRSYSQATVSDNGFLTFDVMAGFTASGNPCPYPNTGTGDPKATIAPFWDSLDPAIGGGGVFVETLGAAPDRTFVVQWKAAALAPGGGTHTFEALLHEGTNAIELRYGAMSGAAASSGSSASIGIQDETGARGVAHSCNVAGGAIEGQSITFLPPSGRIAFPSTEGYVAAKDSMPVEDVSAVGTRLILTDNGSSTVSLPFPFLFYGATKTSVIVSANGLLRFVATNDITRDCPLPLMGGARSLVAPFWEDWNPAVAGSVWWTVDGAPGSRRFIALWKDVPHARPTGSLVPGGAHTFQAILHEGSNAIELRYGGLSGAPESDGRGATIGLESDDERRGIAVSCGSADQVYDGLRWTFTPAVLAPSFEWRDPDTDVLLSVAATHFMPSEGRCDVVLVTRGNDPETSSLLEDETLVTVPDVAPPVIAEDDSVHHCAWPPNHALVTFTRDDFAPLISDNCSDFDWVLSSCSVEPPDADGPDDCVVAPDGQSLALRAERSGRSDEGRRYAIRIVATDDAGNASGEVRIGHVLVPHDQRLERECRSGRPTGR